MTITDTHQPRSVGATTRPSVFVDGASGTTGLGIQERLHQQSDVVVKGIADDKRKDVSAKRALMAEVDLAILCLSPLARAEFRPHAQGEGFARRYNPRRARRPAGLLPGGAGQAPAPITPRERY